MGVPRDPTIVEKVSKNDQKRVPKQRHVSRGVPKGSQGRPGVDFGAIFSVFLVCFDVSPWVYCNFYLKICVFPCVYCNSTSQFSMFFRARVFHSFLQNLLQKSWNRERIENQGEGGGTGAEMETGRKIDTETKTGTGTETPQRNGDTDRYTEKQKDRDTEKQKYSESERQIDRDRERQRKEEAERQRDR